MGDNAQDNLDFIWKETLNILKDHINVPTFKTWFADSAPLSLYGDTLVVSTRSSFAKDWLESRHAGLIKDILFRVSGKDLNIRFAVSDGAVKAPQPATTDTALRDRPIESLTDAAQEDPLSGRYTFENFVIGSSNRFAHAAALSVAEKPARAYNPLFIYGGVGLGKTHLLHAIGHYVRKNFPHLKVKYVSTEKFTNEFVQMIMQKDRTQGFQKKYRNNDVLVIDDIQFLEKREATQEEFFHTFNSLYESDKQIVIASDRHPKKLETLEPRLRSRFEWGLITDIQPPDLETRIAILKTKVARENLLISDDVLEFIAVNINSNVRELEGVLTRIVAFSSLTHCPIDLELSKEVLKDVIPKENSGPVSAALIQQELCRFFKISQEDLLGKKRTQSIAYPRQIGMYLTRELTDLSFPKIGDEFGGRDHTTVMYAINKVQDELGRDRETYDLVSKLVSKIKIRSN